MNIMLSNPLFAYTNVYSEGDDKYEIRVDENALDIQVND
jgi:hypothetical protein